MQLPATELDSDQLAMRVRLRGMGLPDDGVLSDLAIRRCDFPEVRVPCIDLRGALSLRAISGSAA
jgi:hypothetical protein